MCDNIIKNAETLNEEKLSDNKFLLTKKDIVFAIIFFICSVMMSALGVFGGFRAGFSVASFALLLAVTFYFKSKEIKIGIYPAFCFLLSIGLMLNFSITTNLSVRFWSFVLLGFLLLLWFTSLINQKHSTGDLGIIKEIIFPVFSLAIPNLPNTITSLFSGRKNKTLGKIIIGILPAIPVLFVVIPLLMSSDAAFSGMISLAFKNLALTILKLILGVIIALFLVTYCFSLKKKEFPQIKSSNFKGLESTPVISFLSVLSLCYLSYLFSQLAYFFSAFSGFLPKDYDFSLSAYARRGFFEMSVIAAINFIIIFAVLLISRKKNQKINVFSRILCTFIGVFTLVIIATALSKMFLYIKNYGMTELRITTSMFMLFLAVVFITLMLRLYIPAIKVLKTGFIAASVALIILGGFNVNNVIAKYNYTAYKTGVLKEVDISTIYYLGDEGIPYLAKLANDKNEDVAHKAKLKLSCSFNDYYEMEYNGKLNKYKVEEKKYTKLEQFNLPRNRAYKVLDDLLKEDPQIVNYQLKDFENE